MKFWPWWGSWGCSSDLLFQCWFSLQMVQEFFFYVWCNLLELFLKWLSFFNSTLCLNSQWFHLTNIIHIFLWEGHPILLLILNYTIPPSVVPILPSLQYDLRQSLPRLVHFFHPRTIGSLVLLVLSWPIFLVQYVLLDNHGCVGRLW